MTKDLQMGSKSAEFTDAVTQKFWLKFSKGLS